MKYFFILNLSLLFFSCSTNNSNVLSGIGVHFSIDSININTYVLEVNEPFVGSNKTEKYCLYPKSEKQPVLEGITHFIATPVKRVVITSTTHLGFLEPLNQLGSVVGATNLALFYSPSFQDKVSKNQILSVGRATINEESLIQLNGDVVFSYAIDASEIKKVEQLRKLGQKVILVAEYMEQDPLAKAEWVNFFASFFDKNTRQSADSIYNTIKNKYHTIENLANSASESPTVMIGYPWKGNWYVSGGNSFQAAYFEAANTQYIWSRLKQEGSVPLATETVINEAIQADYWINCGSKQNLAEITKNDERFKSFEAYQTKKIYNNYKRSNKLGANDYWESGVIRPDLVLADLIKIMHPELLVKHELVYYTQLN